MSIAWEIKENAVEGPAPADWEVRRIRELVTLQNGFPFPSDSFGPIGDTPLVRIRDLGSQSFETFVSGIIPDSSVLQDGDVVIGMDGDFNVELWQRGRAALNQRMCALRPRSGVDIRFVAYALPEILRIINDLTFSTTVKHLSSNDVLGERIALPSLEEQRRIADFLDAETSRIDRLSSAKTRMLDLIRERQVARTSSLCFRGCESGKHVKESGIAPVGVIPSHWDVVRNKQILREVVELSEDGSEEMLTVSHLTGVTPRSEKTVYMFEAESTVGYKLCGPDDLVINTLWAWMGALGVSKYRGMVSPAYGVYRFTDEGDNPAYFDYVYRTPEYVTEMTRYSKGVWSSRLRLYPESFLALSVPRPPRSEQDEIVDSLRRRMEPEDRLVAKAEISLKLLAERRQALITAAVTGQFDVSTASGRNTTQGV